MLASVLSKCILNLIDVADMCIIYKFVPILISIISWKDPNCPFRKDPRTHLVFLPTLLRWKSPQRLDGERCSDADLVQMLFEDED